MIVTIDIPDEFAAEIMPAGQDPVRAVLEAVALDGYRRELLSQSQVRRMLGFETRFEVDALFKERDIYWHYSVEDLENDLASAREVTERLRAERQQHESERLAG
jgi:Uncharacterised protein family (UPF0175)